jgi:hypothetical protein
MSDKEIDKWRRLIASDRQERKGPFDPELRVPLEAYLRRRWQAGASTQQLSEELGINHHTVLFWRSRWGARNGAKLQLRRVEVIAERPLADKVTLHGPAGTRIENLSLDEVTELWRKLS